MTILQSGIAQAAAASGGYQIARSLRFNQPDSAYLNRTLSSGNRDKWTLSFWFKITRVDNFSNVPTLFAADSSATDAIQFNSSGQLEIITGGATTRLVTNRVFRDVASYMHLVVTADTTNATTANKLNIYSNGVVNTYATDNRSGLTTNSFKINSAIGHALGSNLAATSRVCDMYLADFRFIDGQALDPTSFGEFDANTGVWSPKTYSGTYGTNGFWLKLDDNSNNTAATLGKDSSGNSNNWTPNNFSVTAGVGNDSLVDSPTNYGTDTGAGGEVRGNYATFNPLVAAGGTHTNGNLDFTAADNGLTTPTTLFPSSGKWYCEIVWNSGANPRIGVTNTAGIGSNLGNTTNSWANLYDGRLYYNSSVTSYGVGISTGDVVMMALDIDAGKLWYGKNGTWMASGNPATGANPSQTFTANQSMSFAVSSGGGTPNWTGNFGQRPFAYAAPSGFKALCSTNLPTPAIGASAATLASKNMNIALYTGNGSTQAVTGLGFAPDLVWAKSRSTAGKSHVWYDRVRGNFSLFSDNTAAEVAGYLASLDSDGFTASVTPNDTANTNGTTYVGWAFKAGGTAVTNTAGSISSQVSANPTAGISVVSWTSNAAGATETIGHGLGVTPALVICKNRDYADWWLTWHKTFSNTTRNYLQLNTSGAIATAGADYWAHTSTVLGIRQSALATSNGQRCIAYCFAEVAGFSKFGSYTGNGSADGVFVYLGFRPRYIMIKSTGANGWVVIDAVRNSYNVSNSTLFPHASAAEDSSGTFPTIDFLSNGFKIRNTAAEANSSGATYIFAAFAEAPFQYSRAR